MDRKELWDSFPPEDQILIKESLATLAALGFFNALAKVELQSVVENSIGREPEDILKEIQRYQAESDRKSVV